MELQLLVRCSLQVVVGRDDNNVAEGGRDRRLKLSLIILLRSLFKRSPCLDADGFIMELSLRIDIERSHTILYFCGQQTLLYGRGRWCENR